MESPNETAPMAIAKESRKPFHWPNPPNAQASRRLIMPPASPLTAVICRASRRLTRWMRLLSRPHRAQAQTTKAIPVHRVGAGIALSPGSESNTEPPNTASAPSQPRRPRRSLERMTPRPTVNTASKLSKSPVTWPLTCRKPRKSRKGARTAPERVAPPSQSHSVPRMLLLSAAAAVQREIPTRTAHRTPAER